MAASSRVSHSGHTLTRPSAGWRGGWCCALVQELNAIFGYYDRDRSGLIRVDDVMWGLRGEMPDRRREVVQRAFTKLDVAGAGSIGIEDVALCYNPRENPDVVAGKITERQVCCGGCVLCAANGAFVDRGCCW
jgi:hypothetical protein